MENLTKLLYSPLKWGTKKKKKSIYIIFTQDIRNYEGLSKSNYTDSVYGVNVKPRIHKRAEWFANQMRLCVDRTANLLCAIHKRFAYHSPQTEICWFFAQTQRELDASGVLCLPQVHRKLINHTPLTRRMQTVQRVSGVLVYTNL